MLGLGRKHINPLTHDRLCNTYTFGYIMVPYNKSQVSTHLEF